MKICSTCKVEKELIDFTVDNRIKNKYTTRCKICTSIYYKNYSDLNKEKLKQKQQEKYKLKKEIIKEKVRNYRINNQKIIKERKKIYYEKNNIKENRKEYFKKYRRENKHIYKIYFEKNKEKIKEYRKQYNEKNSEKLKENNKKRYELNKDKILIKNKEYFKINKEKIIQNQQEYCKNKRKIDPLFKLRCNISSNIQRAIKRKGYYKNTKTYQILGCTFEEFKNHLEKQFTKGMSWENQGKWHLDHIYPVSLAKDENELIRLNHYTNFQPLWALDNIKKGNKIIDNIQLKLV